MGNITNRVFESSGPEGKVRGTPAQIIDKYNQLARDAQLANDRVAAENFRQHAEHYTRLLGEAQREIEARREQQEAQQRQQRENTRAAREPRGDARAADQRSRPDQQQPAAADPLAVADPAAQPQPDVIGVSPLVDDDALVVDTPEARPKRGRKPRSRKPAAPSQEEAAAGPLEGDAERPVGRDAGKPAGKPEAPEAAE